MKGFLATLLVLATMDFHMQLAAADESDAIAGIVAKMTKPAALNAVRTSKAVDGDVPLAADTDDDECEAERTTCMADDDGCLGCFLGFDTTGCDENPRTCGALGESYCCMFGGEECGDNAALISYVECIAADTDCDFGDNMCSGAGSIFSRRPARAASLAVGVVDLLVSGLGIMGV